MRNISLVRIHNNVGAYENGKFLGSTYSLTDTFILDVLGIDNCSYTYKEYFPSEDVDNSFSIMENDISF